MILPTLVLAYSPFQGVEITNSACNPTNVADFNEMACKLYIQRGGSGLIPTQLGMPQETISTVDISSSTEQVATSTQEIATSTEPTQSLEEIKVNELNYLKSLCEQLVGLLQQLVQANGTAQ